MNYEVMHVKLETGKDNTEEVVDKDVKVYI